MDITTDLVKNYSKCPLKKRPVFVPEIIADKQEDEEIDVELNVDDDEPVSIAVDEQCEPENLSTKPEDLSKTNKKYTTKCINNNNTIFPTPSPKSEEDRIYVPKPTYPKRIDTLMPFIKEEEEQSYQRLYPETIDSRTWTSPLTPPINSYATSNENVEPIHWQHPNNYQTKIEPILHHPHAMHAIPPYQLPYCKEETNTIYKSAIQVPLYNPYNNNNNSTSSLDLRTSNYNNNLIKSDLYSNAKRFTPYRVDRPLFNIYPLSPASSQASSYNSYESPRRSVSPVSTNSSLSENLPANYSVFQHVAPVSTLITRNTDISPVSPNTNNNNIISSSTKKPQEKSMKNAHYQCPDCSKSYSTYSGLSKHLQFHCPAVEGNQAKKNFSCKNCDKVYTSLGALKMHIRTHTLPCKCDICGKAFSRPWLLQGHIRTHTGEKPFTCQHCHRAFADRSNLRAHLQTHSEIKKYSCTTCSKTFSRMSLLTKHMEVGCPGYQMNPHHSIGYNLNQMVQTKSDISVY